MDTRRQWHFLCAVALAAALSLVGAVFYVPQPKSWTSVQAGMSRAQVHAILGAPTTDSFDLKGLDRWQIQSLFTLRSLDVFYGYETAPAGVAGMVVIHNNS